MSRKLMDTGKMLISLSKDTFRLLNKQYKNANLSDIGVAYWTGFVCSSIYEIANHFGVQSQLRINDLNFYNSYINYIGHRLEQNDMAKVLSFYNSICNKDYKSFNLLYNDIMGIGVADVNSVYEVTMDTLLELLTDFDIINRFESVGEAEKVFNYAFANEFTLLDVVNSLINKVFKTKYHNEITYGYLRGSISDEIISYFKAVVIGYASINKVIDFTTEPNAEDFMLPVQNESIISYLNRSKFITGLLNNNKDDIILLLQYLIGRRTPMSISAYTSVEINDITYTDFMNLIEDALEESGK